MLLTVSCRCGCVCVCGGLKDGGGHRTGTGFKRVAIQHLFVLNEWSEAPQWQQNMTGGSGQGSGVSKELGSGLV